MIIVKITRNELVAAGACQAGMSLFEKIKSRKGDYVYVRWTVVHQLWAAVAVPSFYSWLRAKGMVPQLSMEGADLTGADLRGASLWCANIMYTNLRGANLAYAAATVAPRGWKLENGVLVRA